MSSACIANDIEDFVFIMFTLLIIVSKLENVLLCVVCLSGVRLYDNTSQTK